MRGKISLSVAFLMLFALTSNVSATKEVPTVIEEQNELEASYLEEFETGDYTIDNPLIIQNPYGTNELAAYVAFHTKYAVNYQYTVQGDVPFTYESDKATKDVIIPIVGLYNDTENIVDIELTWRWFNIDIDETQLIISTEDTNISAETSTATIDAENESELTEFMNGKFIIDNYTNIYDENGDLRASNIAPGGYAYLKEIDNQFYAPAVSSSDETYKDLLLSYSVTGRINPNNYYVAPKGTKFHHDIAASDDKLYALTSSVSDDSDYADSYIEVLLSIYDKDGTLEKTIDFTDFYNVEDMDQVNTGANANDVHLNSLDYYDKANLLIIDSRSFSQVIGFNVETETVEWILDDPSTVGANHEDLLLEAQGEMAYGSGEHTVFVANDYIDEATKQDGYLYLSMFDNRQCLNKDEQEVTQDISEDPDFAACTSFTEHTVKSRAIIYAIDLENKTVQTLKTIDFSSYTGFKGGFNMLTDGMKTTYVANAHKFEIYNENDELIGTYILNTNEDGASSEDDPFLYRAIASDNEKLQDYVEINE